MEEFNMNNGAQQPNGVKPDSYLGLAIVATFFNLILGIPAIIFAARCNRLWKKGDVEGAEKASKNARSFCLAAFIFGIIGIIKFLVFDTRTRLLLQ